VRSVQTLDRARLSALNAIWSLLQLGSFSHAGCDAILQSRNIEVVGVYSPGSVEWGRDSLYLGFVSIIAWLCFIASLLGLALRSDDPRLRLSRYVYPVFLVVGVGVLTLQCYYAAQYSEVCRTLLAHGSGR
jgi:hypothetical protein